MDILDLTPGVFRHGLDCVQLFVDSLSQFEGVGALTQPNQSVRLVLAQQPRRQQSVQRCSGVVELAFQPNDLSLLSHDDLLDRTHDWLEEVVVQPQVIVELVHGTGLRYCIEPSVAKVVAYERIILLLHAKRRGGGR
jgi:hypothetical protein